MPRFIPFALSFCSLAALLAISITYSNKSLDAESSVPLGTCNLSVQACQIELDNGASLQVMPLGIVEALNPVDLMMTVIGNAELRVSSFIVSFEGKTMDMGRHIMIPQKVADQQSTQFHFKGMIPVCSVDPSMAWVIIIEFTLGPKHYRAVWDIETGHQ